MTIYIGADHRGFELKNEIKDWLLSSGHQVEDVGPHDLVPRDDFVDYAAAVGKNVVNQPGSFGIVICGSGAGVDMAVNKIKGVRASIGFNLEQVKAARADDNLNVLALASDFTLPDDAQMMIETFLTTGFNPTDNHTRRIEKIENLENNSNS